MGELYQRQLEQTKAGRKLGKSDIAIAVLRGLWFSR
jgi:hypothetical protein